MKFSATMRTASGRVLVLTTTNQGLLMVGDAAKFGSPMFCLSRAQIDELMSRLMAAAAVLDANAPAVTPDELRAGGAI